MSDDVRIFHNPKCSKCRQTMDILNNKGINPSVVEYLNTPPNSAELTEILALLGIEPRDLMRKHEARYKENNLDNADLTPEQLIQAMVEHPVLIERPIIINGNKATIGRPPEKVLEILFMTQEVLILYYSPGGTTAEMANIIARGVEEVKDVQARVRTVPRVSAATEPAETSIPEAGPLYATIDDLIECDGLILGCPTHFGNMPAAMKHFIDGTGALWMGGKLAGKPAAVFSASTSMHGGQETTLLTMTLPLLHHGMLIVGLPYTETELFSTKTGGTPYGATRLTNDLEATPLSDDERKLCLAIGRRVASTAKKLYP